MFESNPVSIVLPSTIILKVIEADAVVKGQTAASSYKPAVLEKILKLLFRLLLRLETKL